MISFTDYLNRPVQAGGFPTEDVLTAFLPLVRQVVALHRAGLVAPLQGVHSLQVENNRLWFEQSLARAPTLQAGRLREKEEAGFRAVEVIAQYRLDLQAAEGSESVVSLQIGQRGEQFEQPVYLPGYLSWEHELGHHDPLTDTFVLGLILTSLTCGLDFNDPESLASFVQHRRNLFDLNAGLHPVLAKAIVRMTELDRHRRPQDLATLLHTLENYRDQGVDFDYDIARLTKFADNPDRKSRSALILSCLQQRLFEISRRNRLLHFRATSRAVNLTWASVPLLFDVRNVRPEQILTWGHDFKDAITKGGQIALNKYLRFEEALYLPSQLDEIRNEARRDQAEYGFAQLRLVVCFLRWANLKEKPPERFDSPLVLLPVRLGKTKGVRDIFTLEPISSEAEINPVLRFYLKQLYAVDLPEVIDLSQSSLDELHAYIAGKVQAGEPAVTIEKIDKPRINLIQAKAQRRLEQYRRRVRLSGRGVRSFLDLDYSYDRDNYHPLGLRLFQTRFAPGEPRLRTIVEEIPRPRAHVVPETSAAVDEKERQLYSQAEEETNPYRWEFDLCNLTLANFHYRKMSLVRDYTLLVDQTVEHPAFDAIFSMEPRKLPGEAPKPLTLDESYPIVSCDPTQASAIALARTGQHFIIQGPPGTGKSQTITNLIADFVAQGKRVLFVCEKRAAIDVVYHRLRQAGLHELSCLIHNAQDDKKQFIFDLKETYEAFQDTKDDRAAKSDDKRCKILDGMKRELAPLEHFQAAMRSLSSKAGLPLHQLLQRAIELNEQAPNLSPHEREQLPSHRLWHESRDRVGSLCEHLDALDRGAVLANHPLRYLHTRFAHVDRPLAAVQALLPGIKRLVEQILDDLSGLMLAKEYWDALDKVRQLTDYAAKLSFLAERETLSVAAPKSKLAKSLAAYRKKHTAKQQEVSSARLATQNWRTKLSPDDTRTALQQARDLEKSFWRFVKPSWWRLRGLLRQGYDFQAHQLCPSYVQVLEALRDEQQLVAELAKLAEDARTEFSFEGSFESFSESVTGLAKAAEELPPFLQTFHRDVTNDDRNDMVVKLAKLQPLVSCLVSELANLMVDTNCLPLLQLREEIGRVEQALEELPAFVPILKVLGELAPAIASAWRRLPLDAGQMEAAIVLRTVDDLLNADPPSKRFNSGVLGNHVRKLAQFYDQWQASNAAAIREGVCRRFLENVRVSALPAGQLTAEQKEFKTRYNRGRRELEHEFNKTMRFRSIRDLVDGDTGLVLQDLKPVWLMSPLSVSDALPLANTFDVVIFDEASQVTLEEAIPTIFRAKQVLVVGDEMQLPPTSFFATHAGDEEEHLLLEDAGGKQVEYDLSSNSLLNHAARNLPATMLGWHYRSRSESLISFSNAAFYRGRLLTVPEVMLPPEGIREIVIQTAEAGFSTVEQSLDRPVSFHFLQTGLYEQRRNQPEAEYVAQHVRGLLAAGRSLSIGIIAFSEAQQGEIEQALERLARDDDQFRKQLEEEREREHDDQFVGLLVKNLENIQGDERDVIILSVCYGRAANGRMLMNFGPINQNGGERRLNVAFSRAKKHMVLVSSIHHYDITNDYNDGARALKNYLRYAEAISAGDQQTARRVLSEINPAEAAKITATSHIVINQLTTRLREHGYQVDRDIGQSDFRCHLAVRRASEPGYCLGIMVDTESYYQNENVLERDLLRPRLLRDFGWNIIMVLTKDWFDNADNTLQTIERAISDRR